MRKLCVFCVAFGAAVFLWQYTLPHFLAPILGGFCLVFGGFFWLLGLRNPQPLRVLRIVLVCLGLGISFFWCSLYEAVFFAPAEQYVGALTHLSATVTDFPAETDLGSLVPGRILRPDGPDVKVMLFTKPDGRDLRPGDQITVTAQCALSDQKNGVPFRMYTSKGVFLTAYAREAVTLTRPEKPPLFVRPAYWNRTLKDSIAAVFPADAVPVVTAVVTGSRDLLDDTFITFLSRSGTAHAVAVSGMHISFLVGFLSLLLGQHRKRTALLCIPLILLFMVTAGSTPSVVRSAIMQIILLLGPLLSRESDSPTSLSFALFLLLLQNPYAVASVGLQLSFAAVAGILWLSTPIQNALLHRLLLPKKALPFRLVNGVTRFFVSTLAASLGAIVLTTPLVAYYFNTVSLISPLINLAALWSVSLTFVGGLVAALLGLLFLPLGQLLGGALAFAPRYFAWAVTALGDLPWAAVTLSSVYYALWLLFAYAVVLVMIFLRRQRRMAVATGALTLALFCAFLLTRGTYHSGDLSLTALDVGQGQSILLTSRGRRALVDCGGNGSQNAGDIAANTLGDTGETGLDYLILTHCHADHANGVAELLVRVDVGTLLLPDTDREDPLHQEIVALAEDFGVQVDYITEDTTLRLGDTALRLYAPMGDGGVNEEGLTVLATCGTFDALMTGDMNTFVEHKLAKYGNLPDCEVFVAGHHGSKNASSAELLGVIKPEVAIISVGHNTYGHPTNAAMYRLSDAGAALYRTDLMGSVTVTSRALHF